MELIKVSEMSKIYKNEVIHTLKKILKKDYLKKLKI